MPTLIKESFTLNVGSEIDIGGWVRSGREAGSKDNVWLFLELNDGSCHDDLQIIVPKHLIIASGFRLKDLSATGTCVRLKGCLAEAPAKAKQSIEMKCVEIIHVGRSDADFPFAKKEHSLEYLREQYPMRFRTKTMAAVQRIRNQLSQITHEFFQSKHFYHVHTPIMTTKDAETAGQHFKISSKSLNDNNTKLTVSGQIHAEYMALGLGRVYTFGPTFRAENSHTRRHLSEFWMIEPEWAFADLNDTMTLIEQFMLYCQRNISRSCPDELSFLKVDAPLYKSFSRITYHEAINRINSAENINSITLGEDLSSDHEKFLTDCYCGPVFVYDWPFQIKPFYMRKNADDETCAAVDLLMPNVGEIVGGGQREERYDKLADNLNNKHITDAEYLLTRQWGSAPHSGFGIGFDRLVMLFTNMHNIRDVIPFPRWADSCPC